MIFKKEIAIFLILLINNSFSETTEKVNYSDPNCPFTSTTETLEACHAKTPTNTQHKCCYFTGTSYDISYTNCIALEDDDEENMLKKIKII